MPEFVPTTNKIANPDGTFTYPDGTIRNAHGQLVKGTEPCPGAGAPKGNFTSLTSLLRKKLEEVEPGEKKSYAERVIETLTKKALKDEDYKTLQMIFNYIDGLPKQTIGLEGGATGSPVVISIATRNAALKAIQSLTGGIGSAVASESQEQESQEAK